MTNHFIGPYISVIADIKINEVKNTIKSNRSIYSKLK